MKTQTTTLKTLRQQYPASPTLINLVASTYATVVQLEKRVKDLEAKQAREEQFWMRYHYDTDGMAGW